MTTPTLQQLSSILQGCHSIVDTEQVQMRLPQLAPTIADLRIWGRDTGFCINVINGHLLSSIIGLLMKLDPILEADMVISLYATISNIMLLNREITNIMIQLNLNELILRSLQMVQRLNNQHTYNENLVQLVLPQLRFVYLVTIDKQLINTLTPKTISKIVDLLDLQLQMLIEGDIQQNFLILIDIIKAGYSLLHYDKQHHKSSAVAKMLYMINNKNLPNDVLLQYANYISFLPLETLQPFSDQLIKLCDLYVNLLLTYFKDINDGNAISIFNFFNHLLQLSELLFVSDEDSSLLKCLRGHFLPRDEIINGNQIRSHIPEVYTKLMKHLLASKSHSSPFGFGSDKNEQLLKNLSLDFYFKIMGNNIEKFVGEIGLLISMGFVRAKQGQRFQEFAQDELPNVRGDNNSIYPLHYNVIEENKKELDLLPEWTEEEKEEEWERLMDTFDKMKKNGIIKMVDNPMDAMEN